MPLVIFGFTLQADLNLTSPSALNTFGLSSSGKKSSNLKNKDSGLQLLRWILPAGSFLVSFVPRTLLGEPCPPSYIHSIHYSTLGHSNILANQYSQSPFTL
ncbi:hypothetical protein CRENBAI_005418, partial [Crenichthys baileyi]